MKLSKTGRLLVFFFIITFVILCIATVYVPKVVYEAMMRPASTDGLFIVATELSEKPQSYYTLDKPDSYVLDAITNLGKAVDIGLKNNSQIYNIIETYGDGIKINIEYNNHYYSIPEGWAIQKPPWEPILISVLIASWIIWGIAVITTTIIVIVIRKKRKPT